MLGFYNASVILTYVSLVSSIFGISFVLYPPENSLFPALFCLMLSGVCDMFDGAVAQRCKRNEDEKMFGIQIDSLCDLVAFGALPALIALRLSSGSTLGKISAVLLLLASVIRLGYFNVQEMKRDCSVPRKTYLGLPVTMVSIFFPALLILNLLFRIPFSYFAPISLILLSALEISRLPVPKPHGKAKLLVLLSGILIFAFVLAFAGKISL